jgi:hypothetical protein
MGLDNWMMDDAGRLVLNDPVVHKAYAFWPHAHERFDPPLGQSSTHTRAAYRLNHIKVTHKLAIGFWALIVSMIILAVLSIYSLRGLNTELNSLANAGLPNAALAHQWNQLATE